MQSIHTLILAAGEARRFARPKQLLPWGKKHTILSHVIEQVQTTPEIDKIFVVLGAWFKDINNSLATSLATVNVIDNHDWQTGVFSSLSLGLKQIAKNSDNSDKPIDGVIVLLGDMPFITAETLTQFVNLAAKTTDKPLIASEADRPAHPYLIRRQHIGEILSLSGESGIRPFIQKEFPDAHKIEVESSVGRRDIDTWESYFGNRPPDSGEVPPRPSTR